jgi:hypothetical protein
LKTGLPGNRLQTSNFVEAGFSINIHRLPVPKESFGVTKAGLRNKIKNIGGKYGDSLCAELPGTISRNACYTFANMEPAIQRKPN